MPTKETIYQPLAPPFWPSHTAVSRPVKTIVQRESRHWIHSMNGHLALRPDRCLLLGVTYNISQSVLIENSSATTSSGCRSPRLSPSPPCSLDAWCSLSTRLLPREALSSLLKPSLCRLQVNRRLNHFRWRFLQLKRRPNLVFAAKS